jgi:type II secretory ATPase GspE/PulE/Tfp pilus assembly ATPase PilB-like protein
MTLEDPVEYPTNLIRQTSISETARLDFASGIRSLMRQDPDIILVGEIRDEDTASMALRAAMTGHQVFSTLHTNSAIGAIPRLIDIGVKPEILAGNLIGIIAQRLARKLCMECRESYAMESLERGLLGLKATDRQQSIYRAKGCRVCDNMGYKGRLALVEILTFDSEMDDVLARKGSQSELLRVALSKGFKTLIEVGTSRILEGTSSLEEITRVVDLSLRLKQS